MNDTKRFSEHFLCDAIRLARLLGGGGAKLSEGIGYSSDFPVSPKEREQLGENIRFIRVEGNEYFEVGFVSENNPTKNDAKYRNKSYHRVIVGREIRKARMEKRMSLTELSQKTNLREHSLARIEDGMWDIDIALLGVILDALGKTIYLG